KMSFQTDSNALVLWFTMADGKTGAPLDFNKQLAAEVADEHGCSSTPPVSASMSSGTNPAMYMVAFTRFPRRQSTMRVRLWARTSSDGSPKRPLTEFEVPNPSRGPFPAWRPELPPISRTNGDLTFVLTHGGNPVEGPDGKRPQFDILRGGLRALH